MTHLETRTPIAQILAPLGSRSSLTHTPVASSSRKPSIPNSSSMSMTACSIRRIHACKPRPNRFRSTIGQATNCPGPCHVTSPPRSVRSRSTPMDAKCSGEASRLVSAPARLDTVITAGSCSNKSSRWGAGDCSLPATTSAWCSRCRASASRYRTRPKSIVSSVQSSAMELQDTLPGCDHLPHLCQRLFGQREPA